MSAKKVLAVSLVSLAGLIVVAAVAAIAIFLFPSRGGTEQNFPPPDGQQSISPVANEALLSRSSGSSSFLYRKDLSGGAESRLTSAKGGIESEASFSHDGKNVVYTFAASPDSKAEVWVIGADGHNSRRISGQDQDALHPVFSPDDSTVYYGVSSFTGNHSPIARPARHEWDLYAISIRSDTGAEVSPTQITHQSFYDLRSLDAVADGVKAGEVGLLISTTGYPIGDLIEQFVIGEPGRTGIFQPHVPGQSSIGPSYGEARFIHNGMDVLFLAATDTTGGTYDYNVYSMSDVTGSEIKQLTHLKGMTTDLRVVPDGRATFINGGKVYALDIAKQSIEPL